VPEPEHTNEQGRDGAVEILQHRTAYSGSLMQDYSDPTIPQVYTPALTPYEKHPGGFYSGML